MLCTVLGQHAAYSTIVTWSHLLYAPRREVLLTQCNASDIFDGVQAVGTVDVQLKILRLCVKSQIFQSVT